VKPPSSPPTESEIATVLLGSFRGGGRGDEESRLQDFSYGGRAESDTKKPRNKEPNGFSLLRATTMFNPALIHTFTVAA